MKMSAGKQGGKYRVMAEINMIPLIDVALVLLIIFMVMTPILVSSQLKINLPKAKSAAKEDQRARTVRVQVDRAGTAYLHGVAVPKNQLDSRLREAVVDPENQPVVVEADQEVSFQHVVAVMDAAKRVGATKLAVSVKKVDSRSP